MSGPARRKRKRIKAIKQEELDEANEKANATKQRRRRKKPVEQGRPLYELPEDDEETESEPKRKTNRRRSTRREIPEDRKDVEYAEKPVGFGQLPKNIKRTLDGQFFTDLIQALSNGQILTVVRKSEDVWTLGVGEVSTIGETLRLSGQDYVEEITSDEWKKHQEEWKDLTPEEKFRLAKDAGAEWEEHTTSRINLMRCATAYQDILRLEKYKPQYKSLTARNKIRARK